MDGVASETEVVNDPFAEDGKDKKASLLALAGEDSSVAAALEEERINDIYFTSKLDSLTSNLPVSRTHRCLFYQ